VKTKILGENFVLLPLYPTQSTANALWSEFGPQQCEAGDRPQERKRSPAFGRYAVNFRPNHFPQTRIIGQNFLKSFCTPMEYFFSPYLGYLKK
jgi:hypothetical protein